LLPPNPKELTPATRRPSGQGVSSVTTRNGRLPQSRCGLGFLRCRLAGIWPWRMLRITLISPHTPAAHSRCPTLDLTDPISSGPGCPAKTLASAPTSMGSLTAVPVPWAST
jgi:hypothetical protein